jgi:hypothetical protein
MMNHLVILEVLPPCVEIIIMPWLSYNVRPLPQALVPIISQLVFTSFHVVLYRCFNFHEFFFNLQNRTCTEILLYYKFLEIIFPMSGHSPQSDSEQESYALFTPSMQNCPGLISERVTPKDLVVTPCTGLQKCWISMHWKEDLVELLNIQISSFVHLWTCA